MISDLGALFLIALLSIVVLSIAVKRGFFSFSWEKSSWILPIRLVHVIGAFIIYFAVSSLLTPIIGKILNEWLFKHPSPSSLLRFASWMNVINSGAILIGLLSFFFSLSPSIRSGMWLRPENGKHSFLDDIRFAAIAWVVSFPLVLFVNQLFDWILTYVFQIREVPEQLAVYFLKMTFGHPLYLFFAILAIIVFAPIIEELLFRGFLQSFIRKHLGSKQAIFITSLLFSLFHFSIEQKMANLTIIASLFVFSLFLGFVYEKRGSLASPIVLHALFNTINVCNLYFLGGIPKGSL